ncbi:hypothetical protein ACN6KF_003029 [Labrys sp. La1]|uniref:hypothetical protein n=1 Tax=Labrys sp. La1 TaxID=3404917 RepID=UPI003EBE0C43
MKDAAYYRTRAASCRRLAGERLEWCENEAVIKRYSGVPASLDERRKLGLEVMAAADDLEAAAERLEARERAA